VFFFFYFPSSFPFHFTHLKSFWPGPHAHFFARVPFNLLTVFAQLVEHNAPDPIPKLCRFSRCLPGKYFRLFGFGQRANKVLEEKIVKGYARRVRPFISLLLIFYNISSIPAAVCHPRLAMSGGQFP